jgi:peptide/nickel transport system permease protein
MPRYLIGRLTSAALVLWGVTVLTFAVAFALPGDPAAMIAGPQATPETVASIRHELELDRPLPARYLHFLGRLAHGDLGRSYTGQPVAEAIGQRLPATVALAVTAWALWLLGGTLFGTLAAARRSARRDAALLLFSVVGASLPTFWLGMMLLYLLAERLPLFPAGGYGTPAHLVLPALTLSASGVAYYARLVHAGLGETLDFDYVRTARAKGLSEPVVLFRHALRNALLPLVTIAGADLAALLGGVVFTESVFTWPGLGQLAVTAVQQRDVPMIMGVVLVAAAAVVFANLVVDLLYPVLDPRIRLRPASVE